MKRMLGALGLALVASATAVAPAAAAKQLKAAYFVSPKHPVGQSYQYFADEVKKETKGELTVRVFPGESLLGAKAVSDGLKDGVADFGHVVTTYTPAYFPHGVLINDLSMVGTDDIAALFATTEQLLLACPGCLDEYAKQGQVPLSAISIPAYVIIGNGDFNSVEKIKLKKLRAAGSLWDRFCRSVGAVAVNMPTAGMYEAMSRGTLDGALYSVGGLKTHGLGDIAKQVIMLNTGAFRAGSVFSMSKATWKSITPDQRAALLRVAARAGVFSTLAFMKGDEEGLVVAKEKGIPVVAPDPELLKLRNDFVEKDLEHTVKDAKEKLKLDDAAEFVATFRKLYDKYEKLVKPLGKDQEKLAELMYKEVFAKLDPASFGMK
ncbi:MAG: C4-dicarboxylate TRAP transporter substrate-binding protein [Hyphomicrobiaceae bacterium]